MWSRNCYSSGAHEFAPGFGRSFVVCVMRCRSLFVLFPLVIVLSVLRLTASGYPFGILKHFLTIYYEKKVKWVMIIIFNQYQQSPLITNNWTQKNTTTYCVGNTGPGLGHSKMWHGKPVIPLWYLNLQRQYRYKTNKQKTLDSLPLKKTIHYHKQWTTS